MAKVTAWMMGAAMSLIMAAGCDDGPVRKAVNCNRICEDFDNCFEDLDNSECKDNCRDDVDTDNAQECAECLRGDSCQDCSVECAAVGIDMLFN